MLRGVVWVAAAALPLVTSFSLSASAGDRWTGGYVGAHVGGAWGDMSVKDIDGGVAPGPFKYSPSGAFGGGTAGYNWQLDALVIGAEADLGYMGLNGELDVPYGPPDQAYHKYFKIEDGLYADITGRAGFAFGDTLIYGKGGVAFTGGEGIQGTTKPWYNPTGTGGYTGWVAGGGIEHFITSNISIKAEYLHFDFGTEGGVQEKVVATDPRTDDGTPVGAKFHNLQTLSVDSVKAGIAYHF